MLSPFAQIHPEAQIGKNVTIEPHAIIQRDVVIGDGCWIGPNANLMDGTRLGTKCKIFAGAQLACIPQDLKFAGESTELIIGEHTQIREFVTLSRGTKATGKTEIGSHCLIMAYAHVAHDCTIHDHCIISNAVQMAGHVEIFDWATIGGMSAIHQFVRIGAHAMVSGGSLVRKDVPPFTKVAREPLSFVGINAIGLKRREFSSDTINHLQEVYRILFQSGYNNTEAIATILRDVPNSTERDEVIQFIKNSERGIIRGPE